MKPVTAERVQDFSPTENTDWRWLAACKDVADQNLFFPNHRGNVPEATRICVDCPVRNQCLQYALDQDVHWGVWGGVNMFGTGQVRRSELNRQLARRKLRSI